ncbi:MAG: hypothetical protein ABI836_02810 [Gemmatimonadota bacterium]
MRSKTFALLLLTLLVPAICSAQTVKPGKWTGFAVPPDADQEVPLTFDVTVNGDSLGIAIHAGEHGDFAATEGHYADHTISFNFEPGSPRVHCVLTLSADGVYTGDCVGEDLKSAQMTMVPPTD